MAVSTRVLLALCLAATLHTAKSSDDLILGKYKLLSDPADPAAQEVMKSLGYSETFVQMASKVRGDMEMSKAGNVYTFKFKSAGSSIDISFESGKEVEAGLGDGRKCKHLFKVEDKVVKLDVTCSTPKGSSKTVYDFTKEGFTATTTTPEGKSMVKKYKRA